MPKNKKDDDVIIDYVPKGVPPLIFWSVTGAAFIITWIIIVAAGMYVNDKLAGVRPDGTYLPVEITDLGKRIDELSLRERALTQQIRDNATQLSRIDVKALAASLPAELPGVVQESEFSHLASRVRTLEEKAQSETLPPLDNTVSPLIMALISLRDRVQSSAPYEKELTLARSLSEGNRYLSERLELLESHEKTGIAGMDKIRARFAALTPEVIRTALAEKSGDGAVDSLKARLSGSITVRKVGADTEGESVEAIIARAEAHIENDNLDDAVAELKKIQGEPRKRLDNWLEEVETLQKTEDAFAEMYTHITELSVKRG